MWATCANRASVSGIDIVGIGETDGDKIESNADIKIGGTNGVLVEGVEHGSNLDFWELSSRGWFLLVLILEMAKGHIMPDMDFFLNLQIRVRFVRAEFTRVAVFTREYIGLRCQC